jgi:colanic acid/amylovoran biosynthesis glycosyltransferase
VKVAYIMSRFPKLTETFVLFEMMAVEALGAEVEVFPLLRTREKAVHAEAAPFVARAHFHRFLSIAVLRANLRLLCRRPAACLGVWWEALSATWRSWNFFVGAIVFLPKAIVFASEMERLGIDHIHAHFANHPALAALVVHRLTGIPFSFTAHAHDIHVDRTMLAAKVESAAFVATIADFNKELIVGACGGRFRDKVHVIHCGVDPQAFARQGEAHERLQIACVASLEPVKGHRYLVEACRRLRDRGVAFTCQIVGDGTLRRAVAQQVAANSLRDCVTMCGPRTRAEVAQILGASDVAVLASAPLTNGKQEGIPVILMEAMAAGLPVVATKTGGIAELVEPDVSGLLVEPGDAAGLADAIETLARDGARRAAMGQQGRRRIMRDFNQHRSAAQLVNLFKVSRLVSDSQSADASLAAATAS